jgi:hypothetical protein
VFETTIPEIRQFSARFDPLYIEKLDPGEAAALAYLFDQNLDWMICSSDAIVYRILGNFKRGSQGISLEEVLNTIGLGRDLKHLFTKKFREEWTRRGFAEGLGGLGSRA